MKISPFLVTGMLLLACLLSCADLGNKSEKTDPVAPTIPEHQEFDRHRPNQKKAPALEVDSTKTKKKITPKKATDSLRPKSA